MYGLHLFILPSCGRASFTVHLSLCLCLSSPTVLVCLPSSCLLCILHLFTSLHTCCRAGTLARQHGWMPGQFRSCFVQRGVLLECIKMQTECDSVLMRCYLAWFCVWSNASNKWWRFPRRIETDPSPVFSTRNVMQKSSPFTFLSISNF